jgi:hypothetical protein
MPSGVIGDPLGAVRYVENVQLGAKGEHYTGTFTLVQYNTSGKAVLSFSGIVTATRITVDTPAEDLF